MKYDEKTKLREITSLINNYGEFCHHSAQMANNDLIITSKYFNEVTPTSVKVTYIVMYS